MFFSWKTKVSLSLAFVAYIAVEFLLYSIYKQVPITLNDRNYVFKREITVAELLKAGNLSPRPGNLVNKSGKLLEKGLGYRCKITVNGRRSNLSRKLHRQDKVVFKPGRDISLDATKTYEPIPWWTENIGEGPFKTLLRRGKAGRRELIVDKNGNVIYSRIIFPPQPQIFKHQKQPPEKVAALTFDDGPNPPYTEQILRILADKQAAATFFPIGRQIAKFPETVRKIARSGFEIGNHSFNHILLSGRPPEQINQEIDATSNLVKQLTGKPTQLLRPPFGRVNAQLQQILDSKNYKLALWNVDTDDWNGDSLEQMWQYFVSEVKPGAIILMHDGGGDRSKTVAILPRIIDYLYDHGYAIVNLSQLFNGK